MAPCVNVGDYHTSVSGNQSLLVYSCRISKNNSWHCVGKQNGMAPLCICQFFRTHAPGIGQLNILIRIGAFRFTGKSKRIVVGSKFFTKKKSVRKGSVFFSMKSHRPFISEPNNIWTMLWMKSIDGFSVVQCFELVRRSP